MTTNEYLDIYSGVDNYDDTKTPGVSDDTKTPGMSDEQKQRIREYNKALCEEYPFLIPTNRFSGKRITEAQDGGYWPGSPDKIPNYDYEYTEMDAMPIGWRRAFGDDLLKELKGELVKFNYLDKYQILQIKEKFGGLRWYDGGVPIGKFSETYEEFRVKAGDQPPEYDRGTQFLVYVDTEHYINPFSDDIQNGNLTEEYVKEYNKDAVRIYHLYNILDRCKVHDIIDKYEDISCHTCIECGKPATRTTLGWISPYCDKCCPKNERSVDINEYYKDD